MKKTLSPLIVTILFALSLNAQSYTKYVNLAKNDYRNKEYRLALEKFDLAFEFAQTNIQKKDITNWKDTIWNAINSIINPITTKPLYTASDIKRFIKEGDLCFKIKEFNCALINYLKVIEADKNNIETLESLRKCYSQTKNYQKNYYVTLKLIDLDPSNYRHYYNFSFYALFKHDYAGARKAAKMSLHLKPNRKMVNSNLAMAYVLDDQYKEAKKIYVKYRNKELDPYTNKAKINFLEDIELLENAGVHHKDFKKAKELLK